VRVEQGDHGDRPEVVGDRQAQQEDPRRRGDPVAQKDQDPDGEGDVGRHRHAPAMRAGAAHVAERVEQGGDHHPPQRRHHRQGRLPRARQPPLDQLSLDLQANHIKEDRHQAVVDEPPDVVVVAQERPDLEGDVEPQNHLEPDSPGRVGQRQRRQGRGQQEDAARPLGVEERLGGQDNPPGDERATGQNLGRAVASGRDVHETGLAREGFEGSTGQEGRPHRTKRPDPPSREGGLALQARPWAIWGGTPRRGGPLRAKIGSEANNAWGDPK
jgi:hypothetical protein